MKPLGYTGFVAQGGDWGDAVTEQLAVQAPPEPLGIPTNMPATVPDRIQKVLGSGGRPPSDLSSDGRYAYDQLGLFIRMSSLTLRS